MKLLTVSVAAYNVEKYIDNLMKSIIAADVMEQLEILIIDDGSVDRTAEIARRYQEIYPQSVRVISKANGGHGSTINRGISEATGKFFRALDGDDWLDSELLAQLVHRLNDTDADLILSPYCEVCENARSRVMNDFLELTDGRSYDFREIWHPGFRMNYHTVIFKTEMLKIHHIQVDEHCFYVDTEYVLYPIQYVDTILFFKSAVYCYRIGIEGQSVNNASRMKNIDHSRKVAVSLINFYRENREKFTEEKRRYVINGLAIHCGWHETSLLLFRPNKGRKRELIEFDTYIRDEASEVYTRMSERSKVTRILRKTRFNTYWIACIYQKLKCRKNG